MYAQVGLKVEKAAIEISLSLNGFVIRGRRKESSREGKKKKMWRQANYSDRVFPRKCKETNNRRLSTGISVVIP